MKVSYFYSLYHEPCFTPDLKKIKCKKKSDFRFFNHGDLKFQFNFLCMCVCVIRISHLQINLFMYFFAVC